MKVYFERFPFWGFAIFWDDARHRYRYPGNVLVFLVGYWGLVISWKRGTYV